MRLTLLALLFPATLLAQSVYAPLNEDYYHTIDRYEVKSGQILPQIFTTIKPYRRAAITAYMDSIKSPELLETRTDQFNYEYLMNDSWEWSQSPTSDSRRPVARHFYQKKSDFFHFHNEEFDLHINPVIYAGLGQDSRRDERLFINTRGIEVRGMVDKKVGFYTYLTDNQAVLPSHVWDQMGDNPVIPHEGFWKDYKQGGVDFLQARGYLSFDVSKHIHFQFGHDRHFIGNGFRSLVFSDFGPPTLFLRGNVKVWKLNYLFLVNQMTADVIGSRGGLNALPGGYPNKYSALHHISVNIGKKLNLGIFESVIFSADDTTSTDYLRLDYFNPIIFYRAIEQQNGSSDNVLIGMDFKWNAARSLQFYGQFVLDEFVINNIRAGNGWWANKFAVQAGAKYVDAFGISNLDLQGEFNVVRPFTYTHNTNYGNYTSYRQPIAHPLGANFNELVGMVRYQPIGRLALTAKMFVAQVGRDTTGVNWGGDILKNNTTRELEFNNKIGQGVKNDIVYGSFTCAFQLKHNLFIEASAIIRNSTSPVAKYNNNTSITSLALRWNIPQRVYDF